MDDLTREWLAVRFSPEKARRDKSDADDGRVVTERRLANLERQLEAMK